MADYKFPTELVDLPSQGHFYAEDSPLSRGKIEIKYMTAKEEDILTSQNLIKQGTVIDVLLNSLIVNKDIKVDDLLIGDKNAIMVAARILGYGKDYEITYDGEPKNVDLTTLEPVKINLNKCPRGVNEFEYKLPKSERVIKFKLLTGKDEKNIDAEVKARQKLSKEQTGELTTRLKNIITSVDGKSDRQTINNFVDNEFLSIDSLEFRKHMLSITPDVDMTTKIMVDGEETEVVIPITVRFFWPST
tara:strand:- start:1138 stop:1875 length:738 start_codon:yes stop_codon:yes gene_type:complete